MALEQIATLANGSKVYTDSEKSHASTHLKESPQLLGLIQDFLSKQNFHEPEVVVEHDAGKTIGHMDLIETTDKDEIVYAKRVNRDNYTKFAKNRSPVPTSFLTIILHRDEKGDYELYSAWIGRYTPPFPGDKREAPNSKEFWATHALVFGNQAIERETLTKEKPW